MFDHIEANLSHRIQENVELFFSKIMQKEISLQRTTLYREKLESKPVRKKREEGEI